MSFEEENQKLKKLVDDYRGMITYLKAYHGTIDFYDSLDDMLDLSFDPYWENKEKE